jgi:hypothetical protein
LLLLGRRGTSVAAAAVPFASWPVGEACCAKSLDAPDTTAATAAILPKKLRRVSIAIFSPSYLYVRDQI